MPTAKFKVVLTTKFLKLFKSTADYRNVNFTLCLSVLCIRKCLLTLVEKHKTFVFKLKKIMFVTLPHTYCITKYACNCVLHTCNLNLFDENIRKLKHATYFRFSTLCCSLC